MTVTRVLRWDRPPRIMTTGQWKELCADSAPPGVYRPNMSDADKLDWKAKLVSGRDPRVEIRKSVTAGFHHAQVLIVVRPDQSVAMSANGTAGFTSAEWSELAIAVQEARLALQEGRKPVI